MDATNSPSIGDFQSEQRGFVFNTVKLYRETKRDDTTSLDNEEYCSLEGENKTTVYLLATWGPYV